MHIMKVWSTDTQWDTTFLLKSLGNVMCVRWNQSDSSVAAETEQTGGLLCLFQGMVCLKLVGYSWAHIPRWESIKIYVSYAGFWTHASYVLGKYFVIEPHSHLETGVFEWEFECSELSESNNKPVSLFQNTCTYTNTAYSHSHPHSHTPQ